jgi:hypothetical protein
LPAEIVDVFYRHINLFGLSRPELVTVEKAIDDDMGLHPIVVPQLDQLVRHVQLRLGDDQELWLRPCRPILVGLDRLLDAKIDWPGFKGHWGIPYVG